MSTTLRGPCDEGVIRAGPASAGEPRSGSWILAVAVLGSSMAFIDSTVVNVALPALQAALGADVTDLQWVVEAYSLMLSSLLLLGGALGDRFGRRRVFGMGVCLFALASVGCGMAPGVGWLVASRAVQGIGGALLVPGSLAVISASFPSGGRGRAIGTWSAFTAVASGVGPVLGGWLVEHAGWRWIFFINAPVAAAVLLLLPRVPESRDDRAGPLDRGGALLATLGLAGVVFALVEAPRLGWDDPRVLACAAGGCAALAAFARTEARSRHPMVPPALFRSRTFTGANLLTLLLYAAFGGTLFFLPFNLIQVQGYPPTAAGAALLPFTALMFLLSRWSGGLVDRYGARRPLVVGPLVAAAGFALLALPGAGGRFWTTFFPGIVVLGLGMAVSVAPLTTTVMGAVESRHAGVASGINNAVARTASLLAVAGFGVLAMTAFGHALEGRLDPLHLPAPALRALEAERTQLAGAQVPPGLSPQVHAAVQEALRLSFVDAFRWVMAASAALAVGSALVAWLWVEGKSGGAAASSATAPPD